MYFLDYLNVHYESQRRERDMKICGGAIMETKSGNIDAEMTSSFPPSCIRLRPSLAIFNLFHSSQFESTQAALLFEDTIQPSYRLARTTTTVSLFVTCENIFFHTADVCCVWWEQWIYIYSFTSVPQHLFFFPSWTTCVDFSFWCSFSLLFTHTHARKHTHTHLYNIYLVFLQSIITEHTY